MKILKWIGIIIGAVLLIGLISAFYLKSKFENGAQRNLTPTITEIKILNDSASLVRGKVLSVECRICHGNDLAGQPFFNDPQLGYMSSPNLTRALGSNTEKYTDQDYIRTLRHGAKPNGQPVMVMPSESIGLMSDEDLGCLIGYLKTVEKVEKPLGSTNFTMFAKILAGAGAFGDMYPYDIIDHNAVQSIKAPEHSTSKEYGAYITRYIGCAKCHGEHFNGGVSPDPISPPPTNITPTGNIGKWSLAQFKETMRGGKTPEGKILEDKFMPWSGIAAHDDSEIEALYNYLKSLPPLPNSKEYEAKAKEWNSK